MSVTMKQTSQPAHSKTQKKIIFDFVLSDSFYSIRIWALKQYFIRENHSKDCKIAFFVSYNKHQNFLDKSVNVQKPEVAIFMK